MKPTLHKTAILENLECAICLEEFKDPRSLECGHLFCLNCILQLKRTDENVACPECRHNTYVGDGEGMHNLLRIPTVSRIQQTLTEKSSASNKIFCTACFDQNPTKFMYCDKCKVLCGSCAQNHADRDVNADHSLQELDELSLCPEHDDTIIDHVCLTCKKAVCSKCSTAHHTGHEHETVQEYLSEVSSMVEAYGLKKYDGKDKVLKRTEEKVKKENETWKKSADNFEKNLKALITCFRQEQEKRLREHEVATSEIKTIETGIKEREIILNSRTTETLFDKEASLHQKVSAACSVSDDIEKHSRFILVGASGAGIDLPNYHNFDSKFQEAAGNLVRMLCNDFAVVDSSNFTPMIKATPQTEKVFTLEKQAEFVLPNTYRFYDMTFNWKDKTLVIFSSICVQPDTLSPILIYDYTGSLINKICKETLQDTDSDTRNRHFSICFDSIRGVYVIPCPPARDSPHKGSVIKFDQQGAKILKLRRIQESHEEVTKVAYCEEGDFYACIDFRGERINFVHPKKGQILGSIEADMTWKGDISIGMLGDMEVIVFLEIFAFNYINHTMLDVADTSGRILKKIRLPSEIIALEKGPGDIIFLRYFESTQIRYIRITEDRDYTIESNIGKLDLPGFRSTNEFVISNLRYDDRNKVLAVGVSGKPIEMRFYYTTTRMLMFKVNF